MLLLSEWVLKFGFKFLKTFVDSKMVDYLSAFFF